MDYIGQLRGFRRKRLQEPLSANAICLYFILLEYVNELYFPEQFSVSNTLLQGLSGLSLAAFKRSREELVQTGYLIYQPGQGRESGLYSIVALFEPQMSHKCTTTEPQGEPQLSHKRATTAPQKSPLNKKPLDKTKTRPKQDSTPQGSPQATKIAFAEYVSMTNDEHAKLVATYGEAGTSRMIELLDNYKGATGKQYKSDYRAILNWVVNRWQEEKSPKPTSGGDGFLDLLKEA